MPLYKISVMDVQSLYSDMSKRSLSGQTVRLPHSVLHQAFKQAVCWRKTPYSPTADVELPTKKREKVIRTFNHEQANLFLKALPGKAHAVFFEVAQLSGVRSGEYPGLTWDCVDFDANSLRVEKAVCRPRDGQKPYLRPPKTPAIPMPVKTLRKLREYRPELLQERLFQGEKWVKRNLVFPNTVGNFQNE